MPDAAELIGTLAAIVTTLGWFPQILKILRDRKADDISFFANAAIAAGVMMWFVYGLLIGSWPVIIANGLTFVFVAMILALKVYFSQRREAVL